MDWTVDPSQLNWSFAYMSQLLRFLVCKSSSARRIICKINSFILLSLVFFFLFLKLPSFAQTKPNRVAQHSQLHNPHRISSSDAKQFSKWINSVDSDQHSLACARVHPPPLDQPTHNRFVRDSGCQIHVVRLYICKPRSRARAPAPQIADGRRGWKDTRTRKEQCAHAAWRRILCMLIYALERSAAERSRAATCARWRWWASKEEIVKWCACWAHILVLYI